MRSVELNVPAFFEPHFLKLFYSTERQRKGTPVVSYARYYIVIDEIQAFLTFVHCDLFTALIKDAICVNSDGVI